MALADRITAFVDAEFGRETEFLAELVKVASELLQGLSLTVEAHQVPRAVVEAAGMKSATNLIVRHKFGEGPVIALNAHGDVVPPGLGWRVDPYGAAIEDSPHGRVMF